MPSFKYRAVDMMGKPSEGTIAAETARDVIKALQEQGLAVNAVDLDVPTASLGDMEIDAPPTKPIGRPIPYREKKLTWDDLKLFNEQIQSIVSSGLPLASAIKTLASDLTNPRLRPILEDMHQSLERGDTLADTLDRHPKSFSPVYRALVRAGERTGNLSGVFATLTIYAERTVELRNKLHEALAYPVLVFCVAVAVAGYLLFEVLPGFGREMAVDQSFVSEKQNEIAGVLCNLLFSIIEHRFPLAAIAFAIPFTLFVLAWLFMHSDSGRRAMDALLIRLPLMGSVFYDVALARFSRALGLLLASRVPMPESLTLAANAAGNSTLLSAATRAVIWVAGGQTLSDSLLASGYFPNAYCWLLHAGEERGAVDETLIHLAEQAERQVDKNSRLVVTLGGPALITCSALLVGFLLFAVYGIMYVTLGTYLSGNAVSGP